MLSPSCDLPLLLLGRSPGKCPFRESGVLGLQSDDLIVRAQARVVWGHMGTKISHSPATVRRRALEWVAAGGTSSGSWLGPLGLREGKAEPSLPRSQCPLWRSLWVWRAALRSPGSLLAMQPPLGES